MRLCNAQLRSTCNVDFFMSQFTAGTCSEHQLIAGVSHLTHLLHASPPPPPQLHLLFISSIPMPMHVGLPFHPKCPCANAFCNVIYDCQLDKS